MVSTPPGRKAQQWTSQSALDLGAPAPTAEAVSPAACHSGMTWPRPKSEGPAVGSAPPPGRDGGQNPAGAFLPRSVLCARFQLKLAAAEYGWIELRNRVMRRAAAASSGQVPGRIKAAFDKDRSWPTCCLPISERDRPMPGRLARSGTRPRQRYSVPAFSSALCHMFAHGGSRRTCCRPSVTISAPIPMSVDKERGKAFHYEWTETSGSTTSTTIPNTGIDLF